MAAWARRINMGNSKVPSIHSVSVPRGKSRASIFSNTEKVWTTRLRMFLRFIEWCLTPPSTVFRPARVAQW